MISLVDFHRYNKAYGWEKGNELISRFAEYLSQKLPQQLIFRVWGDRFVIADYAEEIELLLSESPLVEEGVATKIKVISMITDNLEDIMRDKG